jgi:hypothetical protein
MQSSILFKEMNVYFVNGSKKMDYNVFALCVWVKMRGSEKNSKKRMNMLVPWWLY